MTDSYGTKHWPTEIRLKTAEKALEIDFDDGSAFSLPAEGLSTRRNSAEVQGHGAAEPVLVPGKRTVSIDRIEPVGRYALRLVFDDGHATGLYSWDVLRELGQQQERLWPHYLQRLEAAGMSRDSDVVKLAQLPPKPKTWAPQK